MTDKKKPKRDNTPKLGPEDFYVPPGMDVLTVWSRTSGLG